MLCSSVCSGYVHLRKSLCYWCLQWMPMVSASYIPILSRIRIPPWGKHLCYLALCHSLQLKAMAIADVLNYFNADTTNVYNADNWGIGHRVCDVGYDKHNGIEKTPLRLLDCFVHNNKRILQLQLDYPFALLRSWFHH